MRIREYVGSSLLYRDPKNTFLSHKKKANIFRFGTKNNS